MTADASPARRTAAKPFFVPGVISIFVMTILVLIAPIMAVDAEGRGDGGGNIVRQFAYLLLFLFALWAAKAYSAPRKLIAAPISMILAIAWCWLSLTWAIEPAISVRRLILTTLVLWTIYVAVEDCGYDRTVKSIMVCMVALLAANYVAVFAFPQLGITQSSDVLDPGLVGDWKGVLPHKNFTGATCALTVLLFLFAWPGLNIVIRVAVIAAAGFFLWWTESKTSMGMLLLSAAVGGIYARFNPRLRFVLIPTVAFAGIMMMMYSIAHWDETMDPFRRKDALTGRVQIWPHLMSYSSDHPLTGAGYGSFWNIGAEGPIFDYTRTWVAGVSNGHNGYIDLLVQVGWPGLILIVFAAILIPLWKLLSNSEISRSRGATLIALLIFCVGHNMTETSIFERDVIVGVFLIFAGALTHLVARRASRQPSRQSSRRRRSSRPRQSQTIATGAGAAP